MKKKSILIFLIILTLVLLTIALTNNSNNEEDKINNTKITGKATQGDPVCKGTVETTTCTGTYPSYKAYWDNCTEAPICEVNPASFCGGTNELCDKWTQEGMCCGDCEEIVVAGTGDIGWVCWGESDSCSIRKDCDDFNNDTISLSKSKELCLFVDGCSWTEICTEKENGCEELNVEQCEAYSEKGCYLECETNKCLNTGDNKCYADGAMRYNPDLKFCDGSTGEWVEGECSGTGTYDCNQHYTGEETYCNSLEDCCSTVYAAPWCEPSGSECALKDCSNLDGMDCLSAGCDYEIKEESTTEGGIEIEILHPSETNSNNYYEILQNETFNITLELNCTRSGGCEIYFPSLNLGNLGDVLAINYSNGEEASYPYSIPENSEKIIIYYLNATQEGTYKIDFNASSTTGGYSDLADPIYLNISSSFETDEQTDIEENLTLELIYPEGDLEISQNQEFNITLNLSCREYDCGNTNVSLYYSNGTWDKLVNMSSNATDFYSDSSFETISLNSTNSSLVVFNLNTSGNVGESYEFYAIANSLIGEYALESFNITIIEKSFWLDTFQISSSEFGFGYSKELLEKQRLEFTIENETHHLGVIETGNDWAVVNISSTPQQANLSLGETKSFDVNGDSVMDINVTLESIDNSTNKASLKIKEIPIQLDQKTPQDDNITKDADDSDYDSSQTGGNTSQGSTEEVKTKEDGKGKGWIWIVLVIILVLIGGVVAIVFLMKQNPPKKSSGEESSEGGSSGGGQGDSGRNFSNPPQGSQRQPVQMATQNQQNNFPQKRNQF